MAKVRKHLKLVEESEALTVDDEVEALTHAVTEAARIYAQADADEKAAKKLKEGAKETFNTKATRLVELTQPLARRTVTVTEEEVGHGFSTDLWVEKHYPGYRVVDVQKDPESLELVILIEEDPALQRYQVVVDGKVVGRTVTEESPDFLAEKFFYDAAAEMELENSWEIAKSFIRPYEVIEYEVDEQVMDKLMANNPDFTATLQEYIVPGAIKAKMNPVRKATEND